MHFLSSLEGRRGAPATAPPGAHRRQGSAGGGGRLRIPALLGASAILLLAACSGSDRSTEGEATARWSLRPIARIGSVDGPVTLSDVIAIAPGPDGRLYVTQWPVPEVAVLDRGGDRVGTIGRAGEGPGEFSQPGHLEWRGDTLCVWDRGVLELFGRGGGFIAALRLPSIPVEPPFLSTRPVRRFGDGTFLGYPLFPSRLATRGEITRVPYTRLGEGGEVLDTLVVVSIARRSIEVRFESGGSLFAPHPLPDHPLVALTGPRDGLVVVDRPAAERGGRATFRVTRIDLAGDTAASWTRSYEPAPVREGWIDSALAERARRTAEYRSETEAALERLYREATDFPAYHPPVSAVETSPDSLVWLRREDIRRDSALWEVYDRRGRHVADVVLPADQEVHVVTPDEVWVEETDELDVPYVVGYRIEKGADGENRREAEAGGGHRGEAGSP